ncbi:Phosphatidylinositol mannoside acyltransferase [Planctomycetes bacterium Poly30]|uniref:Phosphatidylinositol mannoside acyltransferase n=1 Tax=Saltatorellus ferox TaxID=2528018 RepID=A0A518EQ46_9BACT|nr:Phosphatidylinositol mannoside acyltransferase [Planctomycetes bacterium Poly30]
MSRDEPLRRRLRARALRALVGTAGWVPRAALGAGLVPLSRAGFAARYGDVVTQNVARALPEIRRRDPALAERLGNRRMFTRQVADFTAEQAAHWIQLARGAAPGSTRGGWVDELVEIDPSIERLDRVLSEGRGAIVITAHIGNWELLCARLSRRGARGAVVGRVRERDSSHRWLVDMRRAYGVETLPQDASARAPLRVLQEGGVLGLLTDLHVRRIDGVDVPFFGIPARTVTAAAGIARLHRAPLVPIRCVREDSGGSYRLSVDEPLALDRTLDRQTAALDLLERQNRTFERWIMDSPEQWAWHQRRWNEG